MALTRITQGVIKPNENYDTHNINSTGIVTATGLNISGNASIGGVLTYEDVTNVDSVGLLTARSGIRFGGHILPTVNETYDIGSADKKVRHLFLSDNSLKFVDSSDTEHPLSVDSGRLKFAGGMLLGNDIKLDPISGIITATSFVKGDGSPVGGVTSDADNNTVGGTNAGDSITNGTNNTFFGSDAGKSITTSSRNTAMGRRALSNNAGGSDNTAIGINALYVSSGSYNVAIGGYALQSITTGGENTIVGYGAGSDGGGNGYYNTALGYNALKYAAGYSGSNYNLALGWSAFSNVTNSTTGIIAIGKEAATGIDNGTNSIFIGYEAGHTNNYNNQNCIVIGANANCSTNSVDNEITLGDSNITNFRIPGLSITIDSNGISDAKGNLRSIPQQNEQGSTHTLVAADAGKHILADNTVTVPPTSGIFSAGDAITIVNAGSSNISIAKGSGVTMYNAADGTDAGRTLAAKGMATILCGGSNTYYISGAGLS